MTTRLLHLTPEDVPALWTLAREQNEVDGTDYGVPRIFDDRDGLMPNIAMALKVVRDGRIVQGHVFERQLELMTFGLDARASAVSLRDLPAAMWMLERQGYEGFHGLVPLVRVEQWQATLGERLRMRRNDDRIAHFYRAFREDRG